MALSVKVARETVHGRLDGKVRPKDAGETLPGVLSQERPLAVCARPFSSDNRTALADGLNFRKLS